MFLFCLTAFTLISQENQDPSDALLDLLTSAGCEQPCYLGIEPLKTTQQQVETILQNQQISDYRFESLSPRVGYYTWRPEAQLPILNTGNLAGTIQIRVIDGIVVEISIPIYASADAVINAYGNPDTVREDGDIYQLLYPDIGLLFHMRTSVDTDKFLYVFISDADTDGTLLKNGSGAPVNQPCPNYGTPPCIAPTAIPNQQPTARLSVIVGGAGTWIITPDAIDTLTRIFCGIWVPCIPGERIQMGFDFGSSSDPDGTIVNYELWKQGASNPIYSGPNTLVDLHAEFVCGTETFTYTLTVTDDLGATDSVDVSRTLTGSNTC